MKYKRKTKKAASKRFKITGSGKIKRYKSGRRHLLGHLSSKLKRNKEGAFDVSTADEDKVKSMLPGL